MREDSLWIIARLGKLAAKMDEEIKEATMRALTTLRLSIREEV